MIKQGIIKNIGKFNDIKLATGLDMTLYATQPREANLTNTGISTETFGDKWFLTPKGRALFKTYDSGYSKEIRQIRMLNELLCQELCAQVGIACATYEPAQKDGQDGLITYDIAGEENSLVPIHRLIRVKRGLDTTLFGCAEAIDVYAYNGYAVNKKQVIVDLFKILVFDTLTLQTDRNDNNINFLFANNFKGIRVAPLIDNEFAFCGERLMDWLTCQNVDEIDIQDILSMHALKSKIFTFDDACTANAKRLQNNVELIAFYAKKHPALKTALNNMLQNLNPKQAFAVLEQQGVVVNEYYKQYVCEIVETTKHMLLAERGKRVSKALLNDYENIY
ncbi:MAG: hypothetical protein IJ318_01170 [Clostridia bacterium]|nr:hypothetical protein [Clostridia bacterium]